MANFFLFGSQINDRQAKRETDRVSQGGQLGWGARCFLWWRSWLVTTWKVKDESLGPRGLSESISR